MRVCFLHLLRRSKAVCKAFHFRGGDRRRICGPTFDIHEFPPVFFYQLVPHGVDRVLLIGSLRLDLLPGVAVAEDLSELLLGVHRARAASAGLEFACDFGCRPTANFAALLPINGVVEDAQLQRVL